MERSVRKLSSRIKDIGDLIKICGESGVGELRFEELHVIFKDNRTVGVEIPNTIGITPENNVKEVEYTEQELKEDQLAMALIEQPSEYERLIIAGELENAENRH
jgi:hypothetical protein